FVGRDRELHAVASIFEECLEQPAARKVLVVGAPGIGKSRLRRELVRRIEASRPVEIWLGRGDAMSVGAPFSLIGPALFRAAGASAWEPLVLRRQRLVARVARNILSTEESARIAMFLGEVAGVSFSDDSSPELRAARGDPLLMADQIRRAFEDF